MSKNSERGYTVRENTPVYYTEDMDKTLAWFKDVLGWYGNIDQRDECGRGLYGCVHDPVGCFHLFAGKPAAGVVGFMMIDGLDVLHQLVTSKGWIGITGIEEQHWGARECRVTTIDGSILRFFEPTHA